MQKDYKFIAISRSDGRYIKAMKKKQFESLLRKSLANNPNLEFVTYKKSKVATSKKPEIVWE